MPAPTQTPLTISAISPSGRTITQYAQPVPDQRYWLIHLIPDEVGTWHISWHSPEQFLEGNYLLYITPE